MIVEFILAAETELDDAVAYLEEQRPGLGAEFARDVAAAIQRIQDFPNAWPQLIEDVRRCQLRRFPYALIYRLRGDVATIYAVMHLKRRPAYWRDRLKSKDA
jgi:plasmid stabilization system protein ParE